MVDKQKIAYKKTKYGNNFPDISKGISNMLNIDVSPEQAAKIMAIMKMSRYENGKLADDNGIVTDVKLKGVSDSMQDMEDYLWISENYEEYLNLVWDKKKIYD